MVICTEYKRGLIEDPTWDEVDANSQLGGFKPQPIRRQGPRAVQQNVEAPWIKNCSREAGIDVDVMSHPRREKTVAGLHRAAKHRYHGASLARTPSAITAALRS